MTRPCAHCGEPRRIAGDDRFPSGVVVATTIYALCRNCGELSIVEPGGAARVPTPGELFTVHMSCWSGELDKIQRVLRRLHERARAKGGAP